MNRIINKYEICVLSSEEKIELMEVFASLYKKNAIENNKTKETLIEFSEVIANISNNLLPIKLEYLKGFEPYVIKYVPKLAKEYICITGRRNISTTVLETSYGDNSFWVGYSFYDLALGEQVYSYEIIELEEFPKKIKFKRKTLLRSIKEKELARLIIECMQSDNDMIFVEKDEFSETEISEIKNQVQTLGEIVPEINEYIAYDEEDDVAITIYGGIITLFEFLIN